MSDSGDVQSYLYANRKYVGLDIEHIDRSDLMLRRCRLESWLSRRDCVQVDYLIGWVAREACAKSMGLGLLHILPYLSITKVRLAPESNTEYVDLDFKGLLFVVRCVRLDDLVVGVCYRGDYGTPKVTLLHC